MNSSERAPADVSAVSYAAAKLEAEVPAVEAVSPVRERPILFSAPMVRAILAGRKTQTRRVVKPAPADIVTFIGSDNRPTGEFGLALHPEYTRVLQKTIRCPYGVPGDVLWVRETCRAEELSRPPQNRNATRKEREAYGRTTVVELDEMDGLDGVRFLADDAWRKIENSPSAGDAWSDLYRYRNGGRNGVGSVVPAIHMPRWASRTTLRITDVRVERLNDCSEADAIAEGVHRIGEEYPSFADPESSWHRGANLWTVDCPGPIGGSLNSPTAVGAYRMLWEQINGPESWDENPWVWVVTFAPETPTPTDQNTALMVGRQAAHSGQSGSGTPPNTMLPTPADRTGGDHG